MKKALLASLVLLVNVGSTVSAHEWIQPAEAWWLNSKVNANGTECQAYMPVFENQQHIELTIVDLSNHQKIVSHTLNRDTGEMISGDPYWEFHITCGNPPAGWIQEWSDERVHKR